MEVAVRPRRPTSQWRIPSHSKAVFPERMTRLSVGNRGGQARLGPARVRGRHPRRVTIDLGYCAERPTPRGVGHLLERRRLGQDHWRDEPIKAELCTTHIDEDCLASLCHERGSSQRHGGSTEEKTTRQHVEELPLVAPLSKISHFFRVVVFHHSILIRTEYNTQ